MELIPIDTKILIELVEKEELISLPDDSAEVSRGVVYSCTQVKDDIVDINIGCDVFFYKKDADEVLIDGKKLYLLHKSDILAYHYND